MGVVAAGAGVVAAGAALTAVDFTTFHTPPKLAGALWLALLAMVHRFDGITEIIAGARLHFDEGN